MQAQTLTPLFGYSEKYHVCVCENMHVQFRIDFMLLEENHMFVWLLISTRRPPSVLSCYTMYRYSTPILTTSDQKSGVLLHTAR